MKHNIIKVLRGTWRGHQIYLQGTIGFDGTILENDQSWLITMATLTTIPRRAVGIVRLKQPENLGPGKQKQENKEHLGKKQEQEEKQKK